jgi:hypothetical protein
MTKRANVHDYSIVQLEKMIQARRGKVEKLEKRRARILKHLEELDSEIANLGGSGRTKSGRARNKKSLNDSIDAVLHEQAKPMKVADIVDAVLAAGYVTGSANFRGIVNQALIKDKRFVKGETRGSYVLKK